MSELSEYPFELAAARRDHKSDPALAVDYLRDFFPESISAQSALDVSAIGDFFPNRRGKETDEEFADSVRVSEPGQVHHSEIQRAALDFQRFAERFHDFARGCQQRLQPDFELI